MISGSLNPPPQADPATDRFVPLREVCALLGGICLRTVQRMIAGGELPRPVVMRSRSFLPLSEVQAFIERKKRERGA